VGDQQKGGTVPASDAAGLGRLVRAARIRRKLSLSQLGDVCDASPSNISEIELGKKLPSLRTLGRLCEALGCRWEISFRPLRRKKA
jgi:XRE family transcriptional regulator, fatty acid utilization regulator